MFSSSNSLSTNIDNNNRSSTPKKQFKKIKFDSNLIEQREEFSSKKSKHSNRLSMDIIDIHSYLDCIRYYNIRLIHLLLMIVVVIDQKTIVELAEIMKNLYWKIYWHYWNLDSMKFVAMFL